MHNFTESRPLKGNSYEHVLLLSKGTPIMGVVARNGKLYADFRDKFNKRIKTSLNLNDTKANRALAQKVLLPKLIEKANSALLSQPSKVPLFGDLILKSLELHEFERSASTQKDYQSKVQNYVLPYLGHMKVDQIRPAHIQAFQNSLTKAGKSASTINKFRTVLYTAFKDAMLDELISKNPVSLVKSIPKIRSQSEQKNPFTLEEIKLLLEKSKGFLRTYIAIGLFTGMRSSEILGLKWTDIDHSLGSITIARGISKGQLTKTKNFFSQRTIELPIRLIPYLEEQFERTGDKNGYIFLSKHGKPYNDIKVIRETVWVRLIKELGIPQRTIYALRHTFASQMISHGEDITWVSRTLGHSTVQTTLDHYNRFIPNKSKKERGSFLDDALKKS